MRKKNTDTEPAWVEQLYRSLGDLLSTRRRLRGLSLQDLADRVTFGLGSICNIEAGRQRAPLHILMILFGAVGMSLGDALHHTLRPKPRLRVYPTVTPHIQERASV